MGIWSWYMVIVLLRFEPRTDQDYYVDIIPGTGGCYAYLPYNGERKCQKYDDHHE